MSFSMPTVTAAPLEPREVPPSGLRDRGLQRLRRRLYTDKGETLKTNVGTQLHAVKVELDDRIGTLLRSGKRSQARELMEARNQMLGVMDNSSAYAQARQVFADESALINAADEGRKIFRGDTEQLIARVEDLSESEREAFMMGAARAIRDKLEGVTDRGSAAQIGRSRQLRDRLRAAFPDEPSYDEFIEAVTTEQTFQDTANRLLRQSVTAERAFNIPDVPVTEYQAMAQIGKWIKQNIGERPQVVLDELGKIYWDLGPEQLEQVLRDSRLSQRAVENIMERVRGAAGVASGQTAVIINEE